MIKLLRVFRKRKEIEATSRIEVCICGSGGQGIILAGIILAEAAVLEGKTAVQTQSYGPEARGGASRCEVVIGENIYYPKTLNLDTLLAMNQQALDKHINRLKEEGTLIVDSLLVKNIPRRKKGKIYSLPFTSLANNQLGNIIVANMVGLGALAAITNLVSFSSLQKAMLARVRSKYQEINKKALKIGWEIGESNLKT